MKSMRSDFGLTERSEVVNQFSTATWAKKGGRMKQDEIFAFVVADRRELGSISFDEFALMNSFNGGTVVSCDTLNSEVSNTIGRAFLDRFWMPTS